MDKEQLLYQYFANQLTEDRQKLFNELLENDPDFKTQFEFEKNLKRVIKKNQKENLKQKLVGFEKEIKSSDQNSNSKSSFKFWSMAASFALLVALGWMAYSTFSGPDYDELYASNFETYPNTVYTITRSDGGQSLTRDAFAAYEANDHARAVTAFLDLKKEGETGQVDFYLAQSYLNLGKDKEAIAALKSVIVGSKEFKAEAHWYLALAYLKSKDEVNAVATLKSLVENFDYKKEKAQTLLKALD
ncbi:tetratricopeptide repeat protein [Maribacter sp. ANRC-HE7]|uniref:Tetratricopeptide repeat protein n=1 Tax=Maribacter aquimaris TaxID=2737171 RepID=A0ABR7UXP9_9FLAO|nr:tetratricopeptide repeat protein [Maribacter aquimaris]MBD0777360.1 tetratricopeptide repeat protein [Maribacter aquimaris]